MTGRPLVDALLPGWMNGQRWFGGKGREIRATRTMVAPIDTGDFTDEPPVWLHLVTVVYADGVEHQYFVPLSVHESADDSLDHAFLGVAPTDDGKQAYVYDALRDRGATTFWSRLFASGGERGPLRVVAEPDNAFPAGVSGDVLGTEQSNTSLVYGDTAIVKFFRRLEPGRNPDVEVHEALRPLANPHVAALLGYATCSLTGLDGAATDASDDERATVAMTACFLPVASDGWSLATGSVRDLFAEADLHPNEVGGDFAAESHRLGAAMATVHADMARVLPTGHGNRQWLTETAGSMRLRLATARAIVPELAEHADAIAATYAAVDRLDAEVNLQRVHGDLHLGQCLRTATGWVILDFEGEPARPLAERRAVDSVLKDVAGMLRSFDYAARSLLLEGQEDPQRAYRATEWATRNRDAYCDGYGEVSGHDPREQFVLLKAMEADKAVYEAVYEARHRPTWLVVPLRSLARITEGDAP
ncbi:MAG: maltokinase N-terminal cap-like domain-containing protein [Mycobacteriales bacterium]|nr:MAG: hypothetical protein DLM56_15350 [Pseudonocardiales bacterium]